MRLGPFTDILDKMQRAAKNGERVHLDFEQVRAFIGSPLYSTLNQLHAEEVEQSWQSRQPVSRLVSSGSTIEKTAMTGASAGMIDQLVQDAESKLVLEGAQRTILQSRRNRRSQSIMQNTTSQ